MLLLPVLVSSMFQDVILVGKVVFLIFRVVFLKLAVLINIFFLFLGILCFLDILCLIIL